MGVLSQYRVSDLALPSPLVSLSHPGHTLFQAIDLLAEKHLLSAPVLAADGSALVGMLDALDIVAYTMRSASEGKEIFEDAPIDQVMGLARDGAKPTEVGLDVPLDEVASVISGPARRAVVMTAEGQAHSVITQSAMLQFLHSKLGEFEALKGQGTAESLCTTSPVTVTDTQSALTAFQAIHDNGVSSVAIVDEDVGTVVSVASATDLVVGLAHMEEKAEALKKLRESNIMEIIVGNRQMDHKTRAATVTVRPEQGLEEILEKLARTRVHRVIVCAEGRKPLGVLSLTDVCRVVAQMEEA